MSKNRLSVLVVDDDREWLEAVVDVFQGAGYAVRAASSGTQAWSVLQGWTPSVVLSDLRMPLMDGAALAAKLRAHEPPIPVIIVTGDRRGAAGLETFDIIEKTAPLERLLAAVAAATKRDELGVGSESPSGAEEAPATAGGSWRGLVGRALSRRLGWISVAFGLVLLSAVMVTRRNAARASTTLARV